MDQSEVLWEDITNISVDESIFINDKLKNFISGFAKSFAVKKEIFLPSLLSAVSNCMSGAKLKVSETWIEKANIYVILISPPGIGKSPTQEIFLQPLTKIEEEEMTAEKNRVSKEGEAQGYNKKLRTLDLMTNEGLLLNLAYGNNKVLIAIDEWKSWGDQLAQDVSMKSNICRAFSNQSIKYTTVKRQTLNITEHYVSIFACVQPKALLEVLKKDKDSQGFYDRVVYWMGQGDKDISFLDQIEKVTVELDVKNLYEKIIASHEAEPRVYILSQDAAQTFNGIDNDLKDRTDEGVKAAGLVMKARSQIFKISTIISCLREALDEKPFTFTVEPEDIKLAYSIVRVSLKIHELIDSATKPAKEDRKRKAESENLFTEEEITEEILITGAYKIKRIYDNLDENNEILVSTYKKYQLWPVMTGVDDQVFIQALTKFGVVVESKTTKTNNRKEAAVMKIIGAADMTNPEIVKLFKMLKEQLAKTKKISFDPLNLFKE